MTRKNNVAVGVLKRQPLYKQLVKIMCDRIKAGRYSVGGSFPSESELISEFGVSSTTARRTLNELDQRGIVHRVQGKGTFVNETTLPVDSAKVGIFYYELFDLAGVFVSSMLKGIGTELVARKAHHALIGISDVRNATNPSEMIRSMVKRYQLDGVIVASPSPQSWYEGIVKDELPVVTLNFAFNDLPVPGVMVSPKEGMARIDRILAESGHTKVVMFREIFDKALTGGLSMADPSAPADAKLEYVTELLPVFMDKEQEYSVIAQSVKKHLESSEGLIAFWAWGYEMALKLKSIISDLSYVAGKNVSLVMMGTSVGPSEISSEKVPVENISSIATSRLLNLIENGKSNEPRIQIFSTEHVPGATLCKGSLDMQTT